MNPEQVNKQGEAKMKTKIGSLLLIRVSRQG